MARSQELYRLANKSLAKVGETLAEARNLVTNHCKTRVARKKMALQRESVSWDDDKRKTLDIPVSSAVKSAPWIRGRLQKLRLQNLAGRLFSALPHGNNQPELGQFCLVMKGEIGCNEGQMGIISERTTGMVRVTYMCDEQGQMSMKLKRPSSLIMLDSSVTLVQEKNCTLWVRPCG
jgi:hypothetical protein